MLEPVKRIIAPGRGKYWLYFAIATVAMFGMMLNPHTVGWFWVTIPFVCTYLVQAFDAM
jgi:hypothetical protein